MSRSDVAVLLVDVQEKLLPAIVDKETILARCDLALKAAGVLGLPVIATEQYPRGLGATVGQLKGMIEDPVEKVCFSCCGAPAALDRLAETKASKVLVLGIEAHVCVQQTVFDLLSRGYHVYVAADAVGSRRTPDKEWALKRMADAGAVITTAESAVFEWTESAACPEFKQISQIIKEADAKSR